MSWEPDIARALKDNAAIRRVIRRTKAWLGHPIVEHHKWYFLALAVVVLVAVPWGLRAEEHALEDASVLALAEAGIPVADISFNGRNAVVTAPADSADAIATVLSDVSGVRKVSVTDGDLPQYSTASDPTPTTAPPTTPPTTAVTTTSSAAPQEAGLVIEVGGVLRLSGTLPDAITVATLGRSASFLYGGLVDNQLLVDGTLDEPVWLEAADDVLRLAPWLSSGAITLGTDTVGVTGTTAGDDLATELAIAMQATIGPDVPLEHDLTGPTGPLPTFEIVATADSVELRGTVPNRATLERIGTAVDAVRNEATISNELVIGQGTPPTYLTIRTPYMIRLLGMADDFAYRYEGNDVRGAVVGAAFFRPGNDDATRSMNLLVDALAAAMLADPDLTASIEIHSSSADDAAANLELSRQRAQMTLLKFVRAGIDPTRIQVAPGDGAGELLRFTLASAENK